MKRLFKWLCIILVAVFMAVVVSAGPTPSFVKAKAILLKTQILPDGVYAMIVDRREEGQRVRYAILYIPGENLIGGVEERRGFLGMVVYSEDEDIYQVKIYLNGKLDESKTFSPNGAEKCMERILIGVMRGNSGIDS
jgi:hypothetical protein